MDIKQARLTLKNMKTERSSSTGGRIRKLCTVIEFLLDELERAKTSSYRSSRIDPLIPCQPPWPDKPTETKKPNIKGTPTIHRPRKGNTGDVTYGVGDGAAIFEIRPGL